MEESNLSSPESVDMNLPPAEAGAMRRRRVLPLVIVLILLVGVLGVVVANRQNIADWWRLRGYQPPGNVSQLAEQDTMTGYTRHLFYLNRPQIVSSVQTFRQHCPENENTIVLGCYHPGENGIFIYNVKDPALSGVAQVTAAHEVLHAIYARLSTKDRNYVDGLLTSYYQHGLTDSRVKDEIKIYQQTEPHDVTDEMNSTFGTEVANLPPPLEAYYKRYFSDRAKIVSYEMQYESAFTSRQAIIDHDDAQLAAMEATINTQESALSGQLGQINAEQARLKALLNSGQATAYNAGLPAYNRQVTSYNAAVDALKAAIDQYNQLVTARNGVAAELATLDKALDTRLPKTASTH